MTIRALQEMLLLGGLALIATGLPALEIFLNRKYPLPPEQEEQRRRAIAAARDRRPHAPATPVRGPAPIAAGRPA
ncbi:hypothetical protein [Enhydrobacter sp.]|jgi:hypothetical protein|uniref:hypothetical protein n=1 Tax=Enhydrobacter sp. TaxID=1894999 RepID=UPI00262B9066|nr:hypothetical protein [Enhydrobacter sp.]WIM09139.1 MAG: hypothetical protein OJF58_000090 [Enhydrobacter sp.]